MALKTKEREGNTVLQRESNAEVRLAINVNVYGNAISFESQLESELEYLSI